MVAHKYKLGINIAILLAFLAPVAFLYTTRHTPVRDAEVIKHECASLSYREQCYAKAFGLLTTKINRDYAFSVLRTLQTHDNEARGCHFIAHSISTAEVAKDPSKWKEVMNTAPADCSYGAVHGALEYYANSFPDGKIPESEIPNLCNNPDTNNCSHGLGHLLLVINENNIPHSLTQCDTLPQGEGAKFECYTGVFMERITAINLDLHGLGTPGDNNWPARVPELEKLCRSFTSTSSVACWKEMAHVLAVKYNNNIQPVINFCQTAPTELATHWCIDHSFGIIAGSYNFDWNKMGTMCSATAKAPDFKERCYTNIINATLLTIREETPKAEAFCNTLEPRYQSLCKRTVEQFKQGPKSQRISD